MRIPPIKRNEERPERPSHFDEDQNERVPTNETVDDYATKTYTPPPTAAPLAAPDPTPVYMVEPAPRGHDIRTCDIAMYNTRLNKEPIRIAGADKTRTRMLIMNVTNSEVPVILSQQTDNLNLFGYPLVQNVAVELTHNSEVWLANPAGNPASGANVYVLIERELPA